MIQGITPACAGNRHFPGFIHEKIRDHPRVCGEQLFQTLFLYELLGSPPRVRGTAQGVKNLRAVGRITPACAGNSR